MEILDGDSDSKQTYEALMSELQFELEQTSNQVTELELHDIEIQSRYAEKQSKVMLGINNFMNELDMKQLYYLKMDIDSYHKILKDFENEMINKRNHFEKEMTINTEKLKMNEEEYGHNIQISPQST